MYIRTQPRNKIVVRSKELLKITYTNNKGVGQIIKLLGYTRITTMQGLRPGDCVFNRSHVQRTEDTMYQGVRNKAYSNVP